MNLIELHRRRIDLYEPETSAFMNAISIPNNSTVFYAGTAVETTGANLWVIINTYVKGLKTAGLWDKLCLEFPIIGGSATAHGINLRDPSIGVITFSGSWVHNGFGALGNGSNTLGDSTLSPNDFNSSTGIYKILSGSSMGMTVAVGTRNTTNPESAEMSAGSSMAVSNAVGAFGNNPMARMGNTSNMRGTSTRIWGVATAVRVNSNTVYLYKDTVREATQTSTGTLPSVAFRLGQFPASGTRGYSSQRIQQGSLHAGLTEAEVIEYDRLIVERETALGRKTW